jgi:hypothetical protein
MYKNGWKANKLYLAYSCVRIPIYMIKEFANLAWGDKAAWDEAIKEARAQFLDPKNNHKQTDVRQYLILLQRVDLTLPQDQQSHRRVAAEIDLMAGVEFLSDPEASPEDLQVFLNRMFVSKFTDATITVQAITEFDGFLDELLSLTPPTNANISLLESWKKGMQLQKGALEDPRAALMMNRAQKQRPVD